MVYVLVLVLMLGAFAIVGWPLLSSSRLTFSLGREADAQWEVLVDQREIAYRAIRDLDFEYQLGNLPQEEYEAQRTLWQASAEQALHRLDDLKESEGVEAATEASAPASRKRAAADPSVTCASCGKPTDAADLFCPNCGEAVQLACPGCGAVRPASDSFCGQCGAGMESKG
jgi:hypothetical protein